jgi:hypothetical protein
MKLDDRRYASEATYGVTINRLPEVAEIWMAW